MKYVSEIIMSGKSYTGLIIDIEKYKSVLYDKAQFSDLKNMSVVIKDTNSHGNIVISGSSLLSHLYDKDICGFTINKNNFLINVYSDLALKIRENLEFVEQITNPNEFPREILGFFNDSNVYLTSKPVSDVLYDCDKIKPQFVFKDGWSSSRYVETNTFTFEDILLKIISSNPYNTIDTFYSNIKLFKYICVSNVASQYDMFLKEEYDGIKNTLFHELADTYDYDFLYTASDGVLRAYNSDDLLCSVENFMDCFINDKDWYRIRTDAYFQNSKSPLYISYDGYIYYAYQLNSEAFSLDDKEYSFDGVLKYKIKDFEAFKRFAQKLRLLK